jgi:endonuclease YncB( thermonuclease family)
MWAIVAAAVVVASLAPMTMYAAAAGCELRKQKTRAVVAVLDGETIRLDDGREVRLLGVLAPTAPPGLAKGARWAPAEDARKALDALVTGKSVKIALPGRRKDRHGHQLAHVFLVNDKNEIWIEEHLAEAGLVRVASTADGRSCLKDLLDAEQRARRAKRGLWTHATYQIRDAAKAHELADFVQSYQIVEGHVREVSERKRRVYLDFGATWSTDLTAVVSGRDRQRFEAAGLDPLKLKGRKVRLRGWVERWNGPLIRLTHPEQIEVLETIPALDESGPAAPAIPFSTAPDAKSPD